MEQRKQIAIRCEQKLVEDLDFWSKKIGIPREHLIKNLCRSGIDDLEIAQSLGLVSLVGFIKKRMERGKTIEEIIPTLG